LLCGLTRRVFLGSQDQMQRVSFLPRAKLHDTVVPDVFYQPLQYLASQTLPCHLSTAEKNRGLDLISLVEEAEHVVLLRVVIVVVYINTKLDLFYGDGLLVLLRLALFLLLLIKIFAVIHDAANGRLSGGRNLDQV